MAKKVFLPLVAGLILAKAPDVLRAETQADQLEPGPFPVGFELIQTADPSRTFPGLDRTFFWFSCNFSCHTIVLILFRLKKENL